MKKVFVLLLLLPVALHAQRIMGEDVRQFSVSGKEAWQVWVNFGVYFRENASEWHEHPSKERFRLVQAVQGRQAYAVGFDDMLYLLKADQPKFSPRCDVKVQKVAVSPQGVICVIDLHDNIRVIGRGIKSYVVKGGGKARELFFDKKGNLYHIGLKDYKVYLFKNNGWQLLNEDLPECQFLAFDAHNQLWLVNRNGQVYYPAGSGWKPYPNHVKAKQIALSSDGFLYYLEKTTVFRTAIDY